MVRVKNRYIVLLLRTKDGRSNDTLGSGLPAAILSTLRQKHGVAAMEAAAADLAAPYYHPIAGVAVVRCARREHAKVLSSCLAITQIEGRAVNIRLLKLTGALRVARRDAGEHIKTVLERHALTPQQQLSLQALEDRLAAMC